MKAQATSSPESHPDLRPVAVRMFWWLTPEEALRDPARFIAQVMTYGNWLDVQHARRVWGESAFRAVLEDAPPGVFDEKSWHYWHVVFGLTPVPPLPRRKL